MSDKIEKLTETMQRIERLVKRFELDMAGRLYGVDYQATIVMLCEKFDAQMRELAQAAPDSDGPAGSSGRSISFGFGISRSRSGEST